MLWLGVLNSERDWFPFTPHPTSLQPLNHETSGVPFASASPPPPFCSLLKYLVFSSLCVSAMSKPRPKCIETVFICLVREYFLQETMGLLQVIVIHWQVAPLQKKSFYAVAVWPFGLLWVCVHAAFAPDNARAYVTAQFLARLCSRGGCVAVC